MLGDMPGNGGGRPRNPEKASKNSGIVTVERFKPDYNRDLVSTPLGAPPIPEYLSPEARQVWHHVVPILLQDPNLLSVIDTSILEDFCETWAQKVLIETAMWDTADQAAAAVEESRRKAVRADVIMQNQGVLDKMRMRLNALRREIGATPAARSALKVGPIKTSKNIKVDDPLDEAFFGGSMQPV